MSEHLYLSHHTIKSSAAEVFYSCSMSDVHIIVNKMCSVHQYYYYCCCCCFREDLDKRVGLGSREMQEAVQRETQLLEKQHRQEVTSLQQK